MPVSRRAMITGALTTGLVAASGCASSVAGQPVAGTLPEGGPEDEAFWAGIARDFDLSDDFINLENGYWGLMARPVLQDYLAHTRTVNSAGAHFVRRNYAGLFANATARTTEALGAHEGEVVLTRGATEALKGLIGGYNRLTPGAGVMYGDLDYYSMQACMDQLAAREACTVVRVVVPEPATHQGLIDFYTAALDANPAVRLLLLTHVSHKTGLVMPVRAITTMARKRGVDVIVDAAHSWGQIDFQVDDLGADFIGFNLHKWIGAPIGVGAMYVRASRLEDIATDIASAKAERDALTGRVHTGTANFAAVLTIPAALDYHQQIGAARKQARLRYLRNIWVGAVRDVANLDILTPDDPRLYGAITSFRFHGHSAAEDNIALVERLLMEYGVFTVHRTGITAGACIRVTPSIYNSAEDCRAMGRALVSVAKTIA